MKIGIPNETNSLEKRVAATPETIKKMIQASFSVNVESNAGLASFIKNEDYVSAGAKIQNGILDNDIILKVSVPTLDFIAQLPKNTKLISPLFPSINKELVQPLKEKNITAFALDLIPRIARAQSMDILSSMSSMAGYKSVILAADTMPKLFPMMTTAAGTITPARVIVIGAGVAGLQAVATARRLGGVVLVFDTRPIVAEQVKSLGADFVSLETSHEQAQDSGGYAKEQSSEFYKNEQAIIAKYIGDADVVITTALIPGKRAPLLITEQMVKSMKPGSVIVDLAIEQQGNCELSEIGKIKTYQDVTLIGLTHLPSTMPVHASFLISRNINSFLTYITPSIQQNQYDLQDEIIKGCLVTHNGVSYK